MHSKIFKNIYLYTNNECWMHRNKERNICLQLHNVNDWSILQMTNSPSTETSYWQHPPSLLAPTTLTKWIHDRRCKVIKITFGKSYTPSLPYLSGSSSRKIQPQEGFKTSLKSPKYCDWKRCNKSGRKVTKLELAPRTLYWNILCKEYVSRKEDRQGVASRIN
jgi:hypothetical protein